MDTRSSAHSSSIDLPEECPLAKSLSVSAEAVNAGEILQQCAGVKVQHGHKPADPDIGVCWLARFHS